MTRYIAGVPSTEETIDRLAAVAERAFPIKELRKRGRRPSGDGPGQLVSVRIDATLLQPIEKRAKRNHKSGSEVIRDAVRAWL